MFVIARFIFRAKPYLQKKEGLILDFPFVTFENTGGVSPYLDL